MKTNCLEKGHDWKYGMHYCAYADGDSPRAFECESCGDLPTCGGETVQRICTRCGAKEWIYSSEIREGVGSTDKE